MNSDTPLDYALFQLSPRRSRCELFVSGDGKNEKLASGLLKPFLTHLKVAEEQMAQAVQSIKLEVEKHKNAGKWFNKGTLERFVRFVSTPEILELVSTFDAELSQLEGARKIYSLGRGDQLSGALGESETTMASSADTTKKELLKAIDVRLVAVKQDLAMACSRASAAGFTLDNVSELLFFADHFGACRLNKACNKFISLCQRRPELISQPSQPPPTWKGPLGWLDDRNVRSSSGSDMSIDDPDEPTTTTTVPAFRNLGTQQPTPMPRQSTSNHNTSQLQPPQQQRPERARSAEPSTSSSSSSTLKAVEGDELSTSSGQPAAGGSRRLSVQDRINMFENKQKERSGSGVSNNIAAGIIGIKARGKAELRRLSSDVPFSVEKSVLRRWSGASDMSIDLNSNNNNTSNNRKESESPVTTPSSSLNPQAQAASRNEARDTEASRPQSSSKDEPPPVASSSQAQSRAFPKEKDRTEDVRLRDPAASLTQSVASLEKDQADLRTQFGDSSSIAEGVGLGDQTASRNLSKASLAVVENTELKDRAVSNTQLKAFSGVDRVVEHTGLNDQATSWTHSRAVPVAAEQVGPKEQEASQTLQFGVSAIRVSHVGSRETEATRPQVSSVRTFPSRVCDVLTQDHPVSLTQFKTSGNKSEDIGSNKKGSLDSQVHFKAISAKAAGAGAKIEPLTPQSHWKTFPGKAEEMRKSESATQLQFKAFPIGLEEEDSGVRDSDIQGMKLHRQTSAPGQIKNFQGRRNERTPPQGNGLPVFPVRKTRESADTFDPVPTFSTVPVQMVRPSKGNQELNDELQMKADELEKLFAAHKLRVNGDQTSSRRGKPADFLTDHVSNTVEKRSSNVLPDHLPDRSLARDSPGNGVEFDANMLMKMVDDWDYGNISRQKLGDFSPLEDSKGKFYERYMQKRDAKLREEWASKRAQKEADMKAMQDSLERSRDEMKAKFAGSEDGQDPAFHARRRAERLRSYSVCSVMKNKEQQVEFIQSEEEEDPQELSEQTQYVQATSFSETIFGDSSSRSSNSKKLLPRRSVSYSTLRTSAAPVPRQSVRPTNSGSGRRKGQPENLLAQSVPNFSDLRKENTKPLSGISKMTTRSQSRNYAHNKSTSEEINLVNEEKPRWSQSMRKSSASPGELKDLSSINSDSVISKEQTEQSIFNKTHKSGESKPFLRKGNGIGPGVGAGIAKMKASVASENLKNGEEYELVDQPEDLPDMGPEDLPDMVKEEEKEFHGTSAEEAPRTVDFPPDSDDEKPRLSQESGNFGDPRSENGDVLRSLSQVDDDSAAAFAISSKFNTSVGTMQESPAESPGSWNSHIHHSFSYAHDASDIDASVDTPIGSPASWNSHPLNQMMEADAARMRKKWGNAQKPILVANSSHQSRKDVTKGFKRLLKFGRKNRGAESLVTDWVSASTTSEGDDDTEDGRDLANRSSEDLRKTRMGFSQYHSAYDGFNEGEIFHEQVQSLRTSIPAPPVNFKLREDHLSESSLKAPRSFFSLSSFRSKGSESKLR